jgi:hypothetical protein
LGWGDLGFGSGLGLVRKRQEEHPKEPNHTRDETGGINYSGWRFVFKMEIYSSICSNSTGFLLLQLSSQLMTEGQGLKD